MLNRFCCLELTIITIITIGFGSKLWNIHSALTQQLELTFSWLITILWILYIHITTYISMSKHPMRNHQEWIIRLSVWLLPLWLLIATETFSSVLLSSRNLDVSQMDHWTMNMQWHHLWWHIKLRTKFPEKLHLSYCWLCSISGNIPMPGYGYTASASGPLISRIAYLLGKPKTLEGTINPFFFSYLKILASHAARVKILHTWSRGPCKNA